MGTNSPYIGAVVDFYDLYSGKVSYTKERDNIIEDWSDDWDEAKWDDTGKYMNMHYIKKYRLRKHEKDILGVMKQIISSEYNMHIVEDGIEIWFGKEKLGKAHLEIETFFSYIYIEWEYLYRRNEDGIWEEHEK